jgi:hypothetical protein
MNPAPYDFRDCADRSKLMKSSANTVIYCAVCYAPLPDSVAGKRAHRERLGHWPKEKNHEQN